MKRTIILLLLLTNISFGQTDDKFQKSFELENGYKSNNLIETYNSFDFSKIWTQTENQFIVGIIGEDYQRIKIKIISVSKNPNNTNEYLVFGKSSVNGIICGFNGKITLSEIKEVKEFHFGVDDEYADKRIKSQGIIIANYEFKENPAQKYSGIFKGKLYSKWYLNFKNEIKYDNIESNSDRYMNNAFIGIWKRYTTNKEKICNWGDFRVPNVNRGFDIGAGEFSPNETYFNKGWADYNLMEAKKWWK